MVWRGILSALSGEGANPEGAVLFADQAGGGKCDGIYGDVDTSGTIVPDRRCGVDASLRGAARGPLGPKFSAWRHRLWQRRPDPGRCPVLQRSITRPALRRPSRRAN